MKWLIVALFFVRVYIPFGPDKTYKNVKRVVPEGYSYHLWLEDGTEAYVPIMFTLVEER